MNGYRVTVAVTGTEALAQARERIPDIVFIDLGPADEWLLRTHQMLRRDRDLKDVPAVLLWGGVPAASPSGRLRLPVKDSRVKVNAPPAEHAASSLSENPPPFRYAQ